MARSRFANQVNSLTGAGHALMLGIVGVAILCDHVVGVVRTPGNIAIAMSMIMSSTLLVFEAFHLLSKSWIIATWTSVVLEIIAFIALNLL